MATTQATTHAPGDEVGHVYLSKQDGTCWRARTTVLDARVTPNGQPEIQVIAPLDAAKDPGRPVWISAHPDFVRSIWT